MCLQDLENNIRNHSDDRLEKIQEIASELVEHAVMVNSITTEVQSITDRWNLLQHQVTHSVHFSFIHFQISILSILFMRIAFHAPNCFVLFSNNFCVSHCVHYTHSFRSKLCMKIRFFSLFLLLSISI